MSIGEKLTTIAENEQKVYDAGKKTQEKEFWDGYINSGFRFDYMFAGKGWTLSNFKPNKDLKNQHMNSMFQYNYMGGDLAATLEGLGIVLDTSITTAMSSMFHETMFTRLPKLDLTSANTAAIVVYNCPNLVTIDEIVFSEANTFNTNTIRLCNKLVNLTISGVIANSGLNLSTCNALSHDSLMSVVNALKTFTDGSTHTITFGSTNLAKLTEEEKQTIKDKGWSYS